MKKKLATLLIIVVLITSSSSFATHYPAFKDLTNSHWAHPAVMVMVKNGILTGYPDGSFKPNKTISRAEFSKVMVSALGLEKGHEKKLRFKDVAADNWASPYIDIARDYLTGYKINNDYYFKPNTPARREDIAVAIVKALDYPPTSAEPLIVFADANDISEKLKPYIATAVNKKILNGFEKDGKKYLNPQGELTRAEASQLLLNIVKKEKDNLPNGEKIVLDDIDINDATVPVEENNQDDNLVATNDNFKLTYKIKDGHIKLQWSIDNEEGLKGFKIVASKDNTTPSYPDDGYYKFISDPNQRSGVVDSYTYNGGDIARFIVGNKYYFSVTAIYEDKKIAAPAIRIIFPQVRSTEVYRTHTNLSIRPNGAKLLLNWKPVSSEGFKYYKVVASLSDNTPQYPENGYTAYIDDANKTSHTVSIGDIYHNGDFEKFEIGPEYYFAITAVYEDGYNTTSNVIRKSLAGSR